MRVVAFLTDADGAAVGAFFGAIGLGITSYFSYKAAKRVKTGNGRSAGEGIDKLADDMALIKLWLVEHIRDHEEHRQ